MVAYLQIFRQKNAKFFQQCKFRSPEARKSMAIRGYKQSSFFLQEKLQMSENCSTFAVAFSHLMQQMYDTYYTSRHSVRELCCDYPADEPLVEGLYAMQMHLVNRGAVLTIPVLNVMNTAHYIAACMMQTGAEGDQYEYDTLAYMRLGHDAQVAMLAIMVLTTMLKRTDGQRARQCRNVLMEDRNEDFYEGLSLYERFISRSERRFEEQDFLTDTMRQICDLQNTVQQLTLEKQELQKQIETMSKTKSVHIGYNVEQMTINMSGGTLVQHADLVQAGGEVTVQNAEREETYISIPAPGKYSDVRRYIEQRKLNEPDFKTYCDTHSRTELCQRLSKEFGWVVDDHSLGRNINRNR